MTAASGGSSTAGQPEHHSHPIEGISSDLDSSLAGKQETNPTVLAFVLNQDPVHVDLGRSVDHGHVVVSRGVVVNFVDNFLVVRLLL